MFFSTAAWLIRDSWNQGVWGWGSVSITFKKEPVQHKSRDTRTSTCKKIKLTLTPRGTYKSYFKWIKDPNVTDKTIKFLGETGIKPQDIGLGNDSLAMTPKGQTTKEKNR